MNINIDSTAPGGFERYQPRPNARSSTQQEIQKGRRSAIDDCDLPPLSFPFSESSSSFLSSSFRLHRFTHSLSHLSAFLQISSTKLNNSLLKHSNRQRAPDFSHKIMHPKIPIAPNPCPHHPHFFHSRPHYFPSLLDSRRLRPFSRIGLFSTVFLPADEPICFSLQHDVKSLLFELLTSRGIVHVQRHGEARSSC